MFTASQGWGFIWFEPLQTLSIPLQSRWVHVGMNSPVSGRCCFLDSSTISGSYRLCATSSIRSPSLEERGLITTAHLDLSATELDSGHCVQLGVSVLIPVYCQKKLLWGVPTDALTFYLMDTNTNSTLTIIIIMNDNKSFKNCHWIRKSPVSLDEET